MGRLTRPRAPGSISSRKFDPQTCYYATGRQKPAGLVASCRADQNLKPRGSGNASTGARQSVHSASKAHLASTRRKTGATRSLKPTTRKIFLNDIIPVYLP